MQMYPEQIVKALINESFHSRWLVVGMFVIVNIVMLTAGLLWPKSYTGSTSIVVDEKSIMESLMKGAAVATETADRNRNVREVILGRSIIGKVLERAGWLADHPTALEQEGLIEQVKARTTVIPVGRDVIRIEYRDSDEKRTLFVTKTFADLFIQEMIAQKESDARSAFDFIDKQAQEYQQKLTAAEDELRQLRSSNLDARPGSDIELSARLIALNTRIENTTMELREAEMKHASLERQVNGEAEVTALATREAQFRARIAELQAKLDTLRLTFLDTHPDIVQLKHQIQDLKAEARAQRERRDSAKPTEGAETDETVVNNPVYQQLRRDLSQSRLTIDTLKARIAEAQRLLQEELTRGKGLHGGDARLVELTRDHQINREIYQDLLHRRERARVSINMDSDRQSSNFKILDPATTSLSPNAPRFWQFVLGGMVLGILIPVGLLFTRLRFDPRVRLANAISERHKVLVAAIVPHLWSPQELTGLRKELAILALVVTATLALSATLSVVRFLGVL
jgi:polysaccharide chain length determinant protein (PEP-CTERM system associated)